MHLYLYLAPTTHPWRAADLLYVLKFILGDFCIVCTGFHVVNFSMLAVAVLEYRAVEGKGRHGE